MYKSYSFNAVNVVPTNVGLENRPETHNAPLPNGLSSNPQIVYLGADAVHTNVPDSNASGNSAPSEENKPGMPMWVWYVAAAAILFVLLKK